MKKLRKKSVGGRIALTMVSSILLAGSIVGSYIANVNASALNSYFDCQPYKLVEIGDGEQVDDEYYKSAFVTAAGNYDHNARVDYDRRVSAQLLNEGSVLLWNENDALPLNQGSAVSLFSNTSVNMVYTGTGSGTIRTDDVIDLKEALEAYKFKVNETLWNFYDTGAGSKNAGYGLLQKGSAGIDQFQALTVNEVPWSVIEKNGVTSSFATYGDAAIYVLGRSGGEGGDIQESNGGQDTIGGDYLQLSEVEVGVLDNLVAQKKNGTFKSIILILNMANAFNMDMISEYKGDIDACMWIGQPGQSGNPGVAKLLCGEASPSGHLVDTYVYDNDSAPAMTNFYTNRYTNSSNYGLSEWQSAYTVYAEGIYMGYKYYETRYEDVVLGQGNAGDYNYTETVTYPFGYGLSYTTFEFSNFKVSQNRDGDYEVTVKVTNIGDVAGRQVAQIYLQKPYTDYAKEKNFEVASVQLVGYAKTKILQPNQSETLTVIVDDQDFKTYDAEGVGSYIRDAGMHYLAVGADAHDALNNILAKKAASGYNVDTTKMVDALGNKTSGNASLTAEFNFDKMDTETYTVSEYTGVEIENQFDYANLNKYTNNGGQKVTYLSRKDWVGTYPTKVMTLVLNDAMAKDLNSKRDITETQQDAEEWYADPDNADILDANGNIQYGQDNGLTLIQMLGLPYDAPEWELLLNQMTWEEQAELCSNGYHTTAAVESVAKPATRDENGPLGVNVTFSSMNGRNAMGWPCEPTRAASFNQDLSELFGKCLGEDMLQTGITGLWGFGLNMHRTAYSGRNFEYYSEDSFLSGEVCSVETRGAQSKGCFIMVKHFAANDAESQRHGNNIWISEQALREIYLSPFEKEFTEGGAKATMTSYNRIGTQWSGGSYPLMNNVLRGEWGWTGFACSDYAGTHAGGEGYTYYQNVYTGLQAGCDVYDANIHADAYDQVKAFANSTNPEEQKIYRTFQYCLRQSSKRICYNIMTTAAMNGISSTTKVVKINTWWQNALIGLQVAMGALTLISLLTVFGAVGHNKKVAKQLAAQKKKKIAKKRH